MAKFSAVAPVDPDGGASSVSDGEVSPEAMTPVPKSDLDERLLEAAFDGPLEEVKELLQSNANIEAKNGYQSTPLLLAAQLGHRDIVDLLLEKNADIEAKDQWQRTPLHLAARNGHRDVVHLLLEKNADIEAKGTWKETPLHYAASNERLEVVTLLLEKGADLGAKDCHGRPTLSYILEWGNQDLIENFLKSWPQDAVSNGDTELKRGSVPERLRTVLAPPWEGEPGHLDWRDANFSGQNLFWAQEVPVTLKHLPGVWGSDAVNEDFLKTLADCPHDGIFETDAVQAMVLAAWQQYRAFTLLEIVSCCLTVICLCWASYGFRHGFALSTPSLYVVAALHLKKSLDESVQAVRHLVQCLKWWANQSSYMTFDNAADVLYLVGGWLAIARQLSIGSDELEKPWMAAFAAAAWLRLLYSLRAETWMGPRLLPILSAVKDTFAFFLLMVICIASATHGYYNLQLREEPTPTYAALMQVVRLGIFGDFDLFEFEGLDPTYRLKDDGNDNESQSEWEPIDPSPGPDYVYVHVLFYMTGVGITVLLMNVLIGVLSSNYERYEAQSVGQFFRARVKMLVELQGRPLGRIMFFILFIPCLPCLLIMFLVCLPFFRVEGMMYTIYCSLGWFGNDGRPASECRIFLVVRDEPDGNEVRSLRAALKIPLEGIQKQQQDLESKIEKVETKLDNMERHHQDLDSKIAEIHELLLEVARGRRNSAEEPEGLDRLRETQMGRGNSAEEPEGMDRLRETQMGRGNSAEEPEGLDRLRETQMGRGNSAEEPEGLDRLRETQMGRGNSAEEPEGMDRLRETQMGRGNSAEEPEGLDRLRETQMGRGNSAEEPEGLDRLRETQMGRGNSAEEPEGMDRLRETQMGRGNSAEEPEGLDRLRETQMGRGNSAEEPEGLDRLRETQMGRGNSAEEPEGLDRLLDRLRETQMGRGNSAEEPEGLDRLRETQMGRGNSAEEPEGMDRLRETQMGRGNSAEEPEGLDRLRESQTGRGNSAEEPEGLDRLRETQTGRGNSAEEPEGLDRLRETQTGRRNSGEEPEGLDALRETREA